jgi:hypothetical protein
MAAKVISPLDKEAWLKLAEDWLRLAHDADQRENPTHSMTNESKLAQATYLSLTHASRNVAPA